MKFQKKTVLAILLFILIFTVAMCVVFVATGSVPDTLIDKVFDFCSWEAGFLGAIKITDTVKEKKATTKKNTNKKKEEPKG